MNEWYECSAFQRDLLEAIGHLEVTDEVPYGLAIKDYLDEHYPEPVNHSRVYQNLDALADRSLVTQRSLDDRTNEYTLSDTGQRLLRRRADVFRRLCDRPQPITDGGLGCQSRRGGR